MRDLFDEFLQLRIDTSLIGIYTCEEDNEDEHYFCTPVGAKIIGRLGVDGIHFCFIRGFGDMVFVVSPMPCGERYVEPIARNFEDFLRLILSCNNISPIEQISWMDKNRFENLLKDDEEYISEEQVKCLETIKEQLNIVAIENPFEYVKELQKDFDYDKLTFSEEYYEIVG